MFACGEATTVSFNGDNQARRVTVPVHARRTLKRGVVESVLEKAGWSVDDLRARS